MGVPEAGGRWELLKVPGAGGHWGSLGVLKVPRAGGHWELVKVPGLGGLWALPGELQWVCKGLGGLWGPRGSRRHWGRVRAVQIGHWGGWPEAGMRGWMWMEVAREGCGEHGEEGGDGREAEEQP